MQPGGLSSLIFVVIIGVWAAYFIQYWVRRREHLATAQSVDQFSESMRVLERRNPQPVTGAAGGPDAQATTAHAAYSQLLLRRAATTQVAAPSGPAEDVEAGRPRAGEPAGRPAATARRTRALVMLGALSTAVVTFPLLALSLLPLWTLLVPVLSIAGSFAWARASARAEQRARRASGRPQRRAGDASVGQAAPERVGARRQPEPSAAWYAESSETKAGRPRRHAADEPVGAPAVAAGAAATGSTTAEASAAVDAEASAAVDAERTQERPVARGSELYDVQAVEAAHTTRSDRSVEVAPVEELVVPARPLVDEDDIPLTWDPVPVPRPTYTMKARVTRPAPTSADLVGDADTEYAPVEDEQPVRRAAGA
ncbi:hypothetical protein ACFUC1_02355 [Pedococcus sp. NPDC057267]|uniref:hypothetical protein n=1 Tax=Pedococcus sp. NPDC057267 TaxID=3346077 RepID=UPI00363006F6